MISVLFQHNLGDQRQGIRATRVYVALLMASAVAMMFYSSLTIYTRSITVLTPSQATFERLADLYPLTLVCPCAQLTMLHEQMIIISFPRFHQVSSPRSSSMTSL